MGALLAMADTLEDLELYEESQEAMRESQVIGQKVQIENTQAPYTYINKKPPALQKRWTPEES